MLGGNPHTKGQLDPFSRLSTAHDCDRQRRTQKFSSEGPSHGERGARTYNGGLRAPLQRGSRGQSPRLGSGGFVKLNAFFVFACLQICPIIDICKSQKITQWMNESFFNDASRTNLRVFTSPVSTYIQLPLNSDKFNQCSCAIRRFSFTAYRPYPKKYTPWLLTVSCCNLSAILLINPLNTVRLSLRSHQRSSALSSLSDSAAESESWLFLPVIVASAKTPLKYDCSFPLVLCCTRLDFWYMRVAACIVVSKYHKSLMCLSGHKMMVEVIFRTA